jgi:uncharacterized protein YndB with AHSA1/START domain
MCCGGYPSRMWRVSRRIQAPADAVWQILVDLDDWPRWGLTVARAELEGGLLTLGTQGRVWTPVGVPLPFEITEFVPGRSWAWQVAGVPATRHGVDPDGDGCRVWMSAPGWAPAYLPVLAIALRRIDAMAVARAAA